MNIAKISLVDAIINFFASLACPTWGCTEKDLKDMGIVKGYLADDIRLDDDLSLYGVYGIPQKR